MRYHKTTGRYILSINPRAYLNQNTIRLKIRQGIKIEKVFFTRYKPRRWFFEMENGWSWDMDYYNMKRLLKACFVEKLEV